MNPSTPHPGDINVQLSIVLSNVGDDVARGLNATLLLGPPLTYTYYLNGAQYPAAALSKIAGDINAGASFTLGFTVNIDPNAKEGIYRYNLQLSYNSARELQQINTNAKIDVPIWNGELHIQTVVTAPTKIYPGSKQVLLKVGIVNSGLGAAKDLLLRLALKPPFTASSSSSDQVYVGNIPRWPRLRGRFHRRCRKRRTIRTVLRHIGRASRAEHHSHRTANIVRQREGYVQYCQRHTRHRVRRRLGPSNTGRIEEQRNR